MIETIDGARVKILGDVHAGKTFLSNVPLHRRGEREWQVWARLATELDPEGGDFHISMGDVFDRPVVPYGVVYRVCRLYAVAALANPKTTFVILRGNHDASRDLEEISAFDLFSMILAGAPNILVVKKPAQRGALVFLPWHPTKSAEEMAQGLRGKTAFGHWDVDLRSDPFNLLPTRLLAEGGFERAFTGHVHLPTSFERDGVKVNVVGSMLPYAHGEDPTGETYVTLSLDEARAAEDLHDKCVRIRLQPGETFDLQIDCLQLQIERMESSDKKLEVSLGEFDLQKLFEEVIVDHAVPSHIASSVRSEWDRRFTASR